MDHSSHQHLIQTVHLHSIMWSVFCVARQCAMACTLSRQIANRPLCPFSAIVFWQQIPVAVDDPEPEAHISVRGTRRSSSALASTLRMALGTIRGPDVCG